MLFHTTQGGGFVQGSSCKAQENLLNPILQENTPDIEQTNGALDSPMDLDELPRIQTPLTGMNQEPCDSENDSSTPCPSDERLAWVSDGRLAWVSESAEQAVNTPNDEERLEQMSHPKKQGDGTDDAPRKMEMNLLGSARKAMERSCLLSWRGVQIPQCTPEHNAFDSSGFLCLGG